MHAEMRDAISAGIYSPNTASYRVQRPKTQVFKGTRIRRSSAARNAACGLSEDDSQEQRREIHISHNRSPSLELSQGTSAAPSAEEDRTSLPKMELSEGRDPLDYADTRADPAMPWIRRGIIATDGQMLRGTVER